MGVWVRIDLFLLGNDKIFQSLPHICLSVCTYASHGNFILNYKMTMPVMPIWNDVRIYRNNLFLVAICRYLQNLLYCHFAFLVQLSVYIAQMCFAHNRPSVYFSYRDNFLSVLPRLGLICAVLCTLMCEYCYSLNSLFHHRCPLLIHELNPWWILATSEPRDFVLIDRGSSVERVPSSQ